MEGKNNNIQELKRKITEMTEKGKVDKCTIESLRKEVREKKKEAQEKEREKEENKKKAEKFENDLNNLEKEVENNRNKWSK